MVALVHLLSLYSLHLKWLNKKMIDCIIDNLHISICLLKIMFWQTWCSKQNFSRSCNSTICSTICSFEKHYAKQGLLVIIVHISHCTCHVNHAKRNWANTGISKGNKLVTVFWQCFLFPLSGTTSGTFLMTDVGHCHVIWLDYSPIEESKVEGTTKSPWVLEYRWEGKLPLFLAPWHPLGQPSISGEKRAFQTPALNWKSPTLERIKRGNH